MFYKDENEENTMKEKKTDFIEYLERSIRNKNTNIDDFYKNHTAIVREYGKYLGLTTKDMEDALLEKSLAASM